MLMLTLDDAVRVAKLLIEDCMDDEEIIRQTLEQKCWFPPEADKAAKRLNDLIFDINPAEICSQIESDNLKHWCEIVQTEMKMAMVQLPCWGGRNRMSVIVKDMKMPESCSRCLLMVGTFCDVLETDVDPFYDGANKRHASCPLVGLPEKHGRLVDADALHVLFENQWHYLQCLNWDENPKAEEKQTGINWCINTLHDDAQTIIEAEEDEE